jgi:hypothetical protein
MTDHLPGLDDVGQLVETLQLVTVGFVVQQRFALAVGLRDADSIPCAR